MSVSVGHSVELAEDVHLAEEELLVSIQLDLGAAVLGEEDLVADRNVHDRGAAVLHEHAGADGLLCNERDRMVSVRRARARRRNRG